MDVKKKNKKNPQNQTEQHPLLFVYGDRKNRPTVRH